MSVGSRTRNVAKFGQARAARAPISLSGALRHRAAPERGAHGRSSACYQARSHDPIAARMHGLLGSRLTLLCL